MNSGQKKSLIGVLALLSTLVFVLPSVSSAFAWNPCTLTLSPSGQSTTIPAGTTGTLTYKLTYSDTSAYATTFDLSGSVTPGSPSGTWVIDSIAPPNPVPSTKSDSISVTITVTVTAPSVVGSMTKLTLMATDNYDSSPSAACSVNTYLTAGAFPPPPSGVPEFPFGLALLMAVAIPVMLVFRSRYLPALKR